MHEHDDNAAMRRKEKKVSFSVEYSSFVLVIKRKAIKVSNMKFYDKKEQQNPTLK